MKTTQPKQGSAFQRAWQGFSSGDRRWGWARLFFLVMLLLGSLWLALLAGPRFWRFALIPPAAGLLTLFTAALFLRDVYELDGFWPAFRYLLSSFFGLAYPRLEVHGGKTVLKEGRFNPLEVIGGPGFAVVQPGNAVLFEGLQGPNSIHASGRRFVPRFERIQPIALEDQHGEVPEMPVVTRDGIEVKVKGVRFRYRLLAGKVARTRRNPYPYAEDAIHNMLYNRAVKDQELAKWHDGIAGVVRGAISQYISRHTLDHLTAPASSAVDPRGDILRAVTSPRTASRLETMGAELLWADIGTFEIPQRVDQQRFSAWQARWAGDARVVRSFGEAQRQAYQEIGRAEAQAELLISMMHALRDIDFRGGSRQAMRDLILLRTAQLLEAMSQGGAQDGEDSGQAPGEKDRQG